MNRLTIQDNGGLSNKIQDMHNDVVRTNINYNWKIVLKCWTCL